MWPHIIAFYRSMTYQRRDGLCTVFERYDHGTGLRIARGLNLIREYVRGDRDVLRDIMDAWELYEQMFPEPKG